MASFAVFKRNPASEEDQRGALVFLGLAHGLGAKDGEKAIAQKRDADLGEYVALRWDSRTAMTATPTLTPIEE